jgi:hypothetical protein
MRSEDYSMFLSLLKYQYGDHIVYIALIVEGGLLYIERSKSNLQSAECI